MTSQVISFPTRAPAYRPSPMAHIVTIDGEYEDDLPPELFDTEEDLEELATYIHMAELALDE